MSKSTLSARLRELIESKTGEYRRFKELENLTTIPSDTWKSWFHGRQRPTAEMIEASCRRWPEHAFWLSTGIDDREHGHHAPNRSGNIRLRTAARDLFIAELAMAEWMENEEFGFDDLAAFADPDGAQPDAETAKKIAKLNNFIGMITQLEIIRGEQEASLKKHESNSARIDFLDDR